MNPDCSIDVKCRSKHAIENGIAFLRKTIDHDGLYTFFLTTAISSKIWTSACIGFNIAEILNNNIYNPLRKHIK